MFDSTVGSCVLWCAQSWTLRVEEMHLLRAARRAMLRRIVGTARASEEDYVPWIRRVTRKAESLAKSAHVRDWLVAHSTMKWSWAGHVARRPVVTWVWRVSAWRDSEWQAVAMDHASARPLRPSRRRWMKWEHGIVKFCATEGYNNWKLHAADREGWANMCNAFAQWCCKAVCVSSTID